MAQRRIFGLSARRRRRYSLFDAEVWVEDGEVAIRRVQVFDFFLICSVSYEFIPHGIIQYGMVPKNMEPDCWNSVGGMFLALRGPGQSGR